MKNIRVFVQNHRKLTWILLVFSLAFYGCFMFPLSNKGQVFNFETGYVFIICYGLIAATFVGLLNKNKALYVYLISLLFTTIGLIFRYLLEYGEYSTSINFTLINILIYLGIIPIFCTLAYWIISKLESLTLK